MDIHREIADQYQGLFNLMKRKYNVILTIDEMNEIIIESQKISNITFSENSNKKNNTKEWLFFFQGGGFNTVWAENKEKAITLAASKYPNESIDYSSFKLVEENQELHRNLLSLFW